MQVKNVSNMRYGPWMLKSVSGGCVQDKASGTFCIA